MLGSQIALNMLISPVVLEGISCKWTMENTIHMGPKSSFTRETNNHLTKNIKTKIENVMLKKEDAYSCTVVDCNLVFAVYPYDKCYIFFSLTQHQKPDLTPVIAVLYNT